MKTEEGVVIEATEDTAKIKVGKHSECKNCGACPGNDSAVIIVRNTIGAIPGQRVIFEMQEPNSIKGAFIIFILPLIGIFVGALLGGTIAVSAEYSVTGARILGGFIALAIIAFLIKILDSRMRRRGNSMPVIIKVS